LLTGPPGVGKTSIAKSIADCLKRPSTVISMAGQNDPIQVRGSKRTYIDSQPGIFIKELQKLEVRNPVIVIDEIDKMGYSNMRGDISTTLLELLNPEQSNTFRDNYLDLEFDFSQCIFVCTSNSTASILQPLLDRIEIISIPSYLPVEKVAIAQNYLIPSLEQEYGFEEKDQELIQVTQASLIKIINNYCNHEAGVRNLRKSLDRIFRKVTAKIEDKKMVENEHEAAQEVTSELKDDKNLGSMEPADSGKEENQEEEASTPMIFKEEHLEKVIKKYQINTQNLEKFLDLPSTDDNYYVNINKKLPLGSSNGLAYIDDGQGSVLKIQFVIKEYSKRDESKESASVSLTHTGRLGETMKESVEVVKVAVFNFLAKHKDLAKDFDKDSYHLHVPMGAIPKDGPSAGISLFAALVSIAT